MTEPRANPVLLGHERAAAALADAALSGRLHHAWLIGGRSGIGKATLAYRFARWLLAGATSRDLSLDPTHPVFRRIAAGAHADLLVIERLFDPKRKKLQGEIVIDTVRRAAEFLHLTPAEGGWRVVVVDGAEAMNRNAANALLKLLEDPPPRAIWLLVSHAPGRLLPTIRSRCRRLDLAPLAAETVETLLAAAQPDLPAGERRRIAALAGGSIGQALALASPEGLEIAGLADAALGAEAPSPSRAAAIADTIARRDDGFAGFMGLLRGALALRLREAVRQAGAALPARIASLDAGAALWQELGALEAEVDGLNLDQRAAILLILDRLHSG